MDFNDYQEKANSLAMYMDGISNTFDIPEGLKKVIGLAYVGCGLGEVGEVQGKIKKIIRDKNGVLSNEDTVEIAKELGDCLWYIAACCKEINISLNDVAEWNLDKLFDRKNRGRLRGSGDNR